MKHNENRLAADFDRLLEQFDKAAWSIACREIQVRIIRGNYRAAVARLQQFLRETEVEYLSMDSHVGAALPVRVANMLESIGCLTLSAASKATDEQLIAIPNMAEKSIALIRDTIHRIQCGKVQAARPRDAAAIDNELCASRDDLERYQSMKMTSTPTSDDPNAVLDALQLIMAKGAEALEAIDAQIVTLEGELDNLKRMRTMLAKAEPKRKEQRDTKPLSGAQQTIEERIFDFVVANGPQKAGHIAKALNLAAVQVGVITARSTMLRKNGAVIEPTMNKGAA